MFQISALRRRDFDEWLSLDDEQLAARGARRYIADRKPGFPCRVSLADAEPGERAAHEQREQGKRVRSHRAEAHFRQHPTGTLAILGT